MIKHSENTEPSNSTKPVLANRIFKLRAWVRNAFWRKTVKKKTMETEYRGYIISQDITGYAPKDSQFAFFLDDGELYCGRGESIEDCKQQIDEL